MKEISMKWNADCSVILTPNDIFRLLFVSSLLDGLIDGLRKQLSRSVTRAKYQNHCKRTLLHSDFSHSIDAMLPRQLGNQNKGFSQQCWGTDLFLFLLDFSCCLDDLGSPWSPAVGWHKLGRRWGFALGQTQARDCPPLLSLISALLSLISAYRRRILLYSTTAWR